MKLRPYVNTKHPGVTESSEKTLMKESQMRVQIKITRNKASISSNSKFHLKSAGLNLNGSAQFFEMLKQEVSLLRFFLVFAFFTTFCCRKKYEVFKN